MNPFTVDRLRSWISVLLVAGWILGVFVTPCKANPIAVSEYSVKAAFLNNFIHFVEWPLSAFPDPGAALTIGVLGDDPFGPLLEQAVKEEKAKGNGVVIRRFKSVDDVTSCHVLFISRSEKERMFLILKRLEEVPILTVSEMEGFADHGGIVNFYIENNRIRFEINKESAYRKGLKISSRLLCLARIVEQKSVKEAR
ncbi:MAG: YfiR family protein [bacterium]